MVQLQRIGKDKVINHHHDVPYKVLNKNYTFGEKNSGNKIIHGDNLEALKSLLPQYEGKVDCIYIDPPYNTGNEGWIYNDNVNDPKIKKRLNEVVGKEGEDLSRHDKWLCMMYPRLKLLQKLLSNDGVIFISIDDNEQSNLKLLSDEIFGNDNFIANITVKSNPRGSMSDSEVAKLHEYILIYTKKRNFAQIMGHELTDDMKKEYCYEDDNGKYRLLGLRMRGGFWRRTERPNLYFPIFVNSKTMEISLEKTNDFCEEVLPIQPSTGEDGTWRWSKEKIKQGKGYLIAKKVKRGKEFVYDIFQKDYFNREDGRKTKVKSIWDEKDMNYQNGTICIKNIFGNSKLFDYAKPIALVEQAINSIAQKDNMIILDSFAGSGTTAHAVLDLNKQDGGNRKFILVELGDYAENITAERVKRVINGYGEGDKKVEGTGGGFDFYELGEKLFIDSETLNENVGEETLRDYIRYSETKEEIQPRDSGNKYFLGTNFDTDYYFYYEKESITELNYDFLAKIKREKNHGLIIYADVCSLSDEFLKKNNIIFKKIPRDISQF